MIIALVLVAIILVTIAVLIPTVFLDDGAVWKRSFYLHEKHNRTNEYDMEDAHFGEAVAISADGSRLVFRGNDALEVWDWLDREWVFKYRFEGDFRGEHQIHLSDAGSRIAVVQRDSGIFNFSIALNNFTIGSNVSLDTVVVYDDVSKGKGTEWVQVGETLHGLYYLNLTDPDLLLGIFEDDDWWAQYQMFVPARNFADSVSLSGDGTTICSGAPRTDILPTNSSTSFAFDVGTVQCFHHLDTFALPPTEFPNVTWIPSQGIWGTRDREYLGAKVALSANGTVLVATRDISWDSPIASFYKYEEKEWKQTWDVGISGMNNDLFLSSATHNCNIE